MLKIHFHKMFTNWKQQVPSLVVEEVVYLKCIFLMLDGTFFLWVSIATCCRPVLWHINLFVDLSEAVWLPILNILAFGFQANQKVLIIMKFVNLKYLWNHHIWKSKRLPSTYKTVTILKKYFHILEIIYLRKVILSLKRIHWCFSSEQLLWWIKGQSLPLLTFYFLQQFELLLFCDKTQRISIHSFFVHRKALVFSYGQFFCLWLTAEPRTHVSSCPGRCQSGRDDVELLSCTQIRVGLSPIDSGFSCEKMNFEYFLTYPFQSLWGTESLSECAWQTNE